MELKDILRGKRISILGDSISTYEGVSNDRKANVTTRRNPAYYRPPFQLCDTWWMRIIVKYEMILCVNNSWSGGFLCGRLPEFGEDFNSGVYRANELADNEGNSPDIIVIFIGINDLGHSIGDDRFGEAYNSVLDTISEKYPESEVFCVSLPDRGKEYDYLAHRQNNAMQNAINSHGKNIHYVDLFHSILNNDYYRKNTYDGLHPTPSGMEILANLIENSFKVFETAES